MQPSKITWDYPFKQTKWGRKSHDTVPLMFLPTDRFISRLDTSKLCILRIRLFDNKMSRAEYSFNTATLYMSLFEPYSMYRIICCWTYCFRAVCGHILFLEYIKMKRPNIILWNWRKSFGLINVVKEMVTLSFYIIS